MKNIQTLLVAVLCLACFGAQAQWQWIDKDGRRVFSDRAPPADVPPRNILKQPGGAARGADALVNAAPARAASAPGSVVAATPAPDLPTPQLSAADKDLADKKKQADAAAVAKVKLEEEKVARAKTENCERARANKAVMDSGVRVSLSTNATGEREILDDAGRAAELKRIQMAIEASCK